ncbi:hypothetical protein AMJ44_08435 [candidate division WOR-1 bacterium DG_54_3]|uniref:Polyamine aminopropyltransferase n=1 Tax=candidate division WOR-1 bacterium DG_54_3 TaxID=1703775 RepID=A0A0S7XVT2_UNCSA|nr:MAG: hypothetical protein AMJ44_08435 [candidate division WOR-1 bacterium DG_54_3]
MKSGNLKKYAFLFAIALIGTAAITSQILLIREIINVFAGNELLYGLTIFLWLILYSSGSGLLGRFGDKLKNKFIAFITLQSLVAVLLPIEIFFSRIIKNLFGITLGATVDLSTTIFIIVLLLAPITLILGFQFALASLLLSETFQKESSQISRVYIFEALGSILGGLILAYLLIFFLNAFQIAAVLAVLISISFKAIGWSLSKKNIIFLGSGILIIALLLFASASYLNFYSAQQSWKNYHLVETTDSPYGRISITEDQGAHSIFENGGLVFSTADQLGNEEVAHLSLLLHPGPQDILLIGGGASGITDEILKYPIRSLDYVELDYKIIELAKKFARINPKVNIYTIDGVKYIQDTAKKYDLIIINLPDPSTTQINRFYTLEFFKKCKDRLAKGGILTLNLETSEAYLGRELKLLNQSIFKTLSHAFTHAVIIPGNFNYFFGSESKLVENRNALLRRWEERKIQTKYFRSDTLYYLLWPDKIKYVEEAVSFKDSTPLNTELKPISYYFELLIWASYFFSPLKNFFYALMKINFPYFLLILIAIFTVIKLISLKLRRITLPTIIALLGFTGMCVQLIIIYTFQSLYGYVYQTIGLLTTAFMAGLAMGSFLIYRQYDQIRDPSQMLKRILWLLLFNIAMIFILLKTFPLPLASFLVSLPIGAAFPLAVKIHEKYKPEIGSLAGILYGSDLLGGALAAIVTTILFIPIFGILSTFGVAITLALAAVVISYS